MAVSNLETVLTTRTKDVVLEQMLVDAALLGMQLRGMQKERIGRALVEIESTTIADWEEKRKEIANGGFLDSSEGAWLDLLALGWFNLPRQPATFTAGKIRFTAGAGVGPIQIDVGTRWATSSTNLRFLNTEAALVPLGGFVDIAYKAELAGAAGNVANGSITKLATPIPGVTISNPAIGSTGTWITAPGIDQELDLSLRARCRNRWGALGAGAGVGAYANWITEAFTSAGLVSPITRYRINDANPFGPGSIGVSLATSTGAPLAADVNTVNAYLQARKALGSGELRVFAATVFNQAIVATVFQTGNPAAAAQAQSKLTSFASTFPIGGTLFRAELIEQIMSVAGVFNVVMLTPSNDVTLPSLDHVLTLDVSGVV